MRISDWSSDVCSSDLTRVIPLPAQGGARGGSARRGARCPPDVPCLGRAGGVFWPADAGTHPLIPSLEGRGEKERDMALDDLAILVRVIDAGRLSAAGRALGFPPAMVSKRIARLEQRTGVGLLQRTTRRLSPTQTGHAFYGPAV